MISEEEDITSFLDSIERLQFVSENFDFLRRKEFVANNKPKFKYSDFVYYKGERQQVMAVKLRNDEYGNLCYSYLIVDNKLTVRDFIQEKELTFKNK